jgi:hypothetical protein|nr:MAG TPA: hypothetical protein [Caudoviricetes sp.]
MFKYFHLLPGEVSEQKPRLLFNMLDGLDSTNDEESEIPEEWGWFYGK